MSKRKNTKEARVYNSYKSSRTETKHDINALDNNGFSPLHRAVLENKISEVIKLLNQKADPTVKAKESTYYELSNFTRNTNFEDYFTNLSGASAMHLAAFTGNVDIMRILNITNQKLINSKNSLNYSPVDIAANAGQLEAVKLFFDEMKDNLRPNAVRIKALNGAILRGHYEIIKVLLDNCHDLGIFDPEEYYLPTIISSFEKEDREYYFPLHDALDMMQNDTNMRNSSDSIKLDFIKLLLDHNIDVNILDFDDESALEVEIYETESYTKEIAQMFLKKGCEVSWKTLSKAAKYIASDPIFKMLCTAFFTDAICRNDIDAVNKIRQSEKYPCDLDQEHASIAYYRLMLSALKPGAVSVASIQQTLANIKINLTQLNDNTSADLTFLEKVLYQSHHITERIS